MTRFLLAFALMTGLGTASAADVNIGVGVNVGGGHRHRDRGYHHHRYHGDHHHHYHHHRHGGIIIGGPIVVGGHYENRTELVIVRSGYYQIVQDKYKNEEGKEIIVEKKVWVEPVYEERVVRIWVPHKVGGGFFLKF